MNPIKHPLCNDVLRRPPDMTEEECGDLHICREDAAVWSFWNPNAEELAALVMGGSVALRVMGQTHPPLSIMATTPTEDTAKQTTPAENAVIDTAIRGRHVALIKLTKRIVAAWVKSSDDNLLRRTLTDQFLDMMSVNTGKGEVIREVVAGDEPDTVTERDAARYRSDAEGWKAEAERFDGQLRKISEALGDEWNIIPFDEAIKTLRNRLADATALAEKAKLEIAELERCLAIKRENIIAGVEELIHKAFNPKHNEG